MSCYSVIILQEEVSLQDQVWLIRLLSLPFSATASARQLRNEKQSQEERRNNPR